MPSRWVNAAWAVALVSPPLALLAFQLNYAITLPYMDAWELVPYIEKAKAGTLRLGDLLDQHNAHRIALPRAIMLLLALATRWDHRAEIATIALAACAAFGLWHTLLPRVANTDRRPQLVLVSLGTFSLAAWRNWIWGWQLTILLCLVFALLCIACLNSQRLGKLRHPLAIAAAVAATFSFAAGFAIWPAAAIMLALQRAKPRTANLRLGALRLGALWLGAFALTTAAYLVGFHKPPDATQIQGAQTILPIITYTFAYLGGSLLAWTPTGAFGLGLAGTILFIWVVAKMPDSNMPDPNMPDPQRRENAPLIAIAAFALITAAISATGRADEGIAQAVASRYTTFGSVFWIALALLLLQSKNIPRRRTTAYAIAILFAFQSVHGAYQGRQRAIYFNDARDALIAGEPIEEFARLFPDTDTIIERRTFLQTHKLSVFRSSE